MSREYYENNEYLNEYYFSLPEHIQEAIAESKVEITTLGELMQCAEHMMHNPT